MPRSKRVKAAARPGAAALALTHIRTVSDRRARAVELYERALLANDRARNCLARAHRLLREASKYLDEDPPLFPPMLDWLP